MEIDISRLIRNYCDNLVQNNHAGMLSLFTKDAIVVSPFSQNTAENFYADLFKRSKRTSVKIKNFFSDLNNSNIFAAYLDYEGIMKDKPIRFNCVDVFEFDLDVKKIKKLTIIWDTYPVRLKLGI